MIRGSLALLALVCTIAACGQPQDSAPEPSASAPSASPSPAAAPSAGPEADAAALAALAALPAPFNEADYANGQRMFGQCRSCHSLDPNAGHRLGPSLHGVFGRHVGAIEEFAYSQALADADFAWSAENLDPWLENPRTFLPGNRMAYAGMRDADDRRDLIAYLMVETATAP